MTLNRDDINNLFAQLDIIYPASNLALRDQETLKAMKTLWYQALVEERITVEDLKRGLRRAIKTKTNFFPSIGVFIDMCRPGPADLNIPPVDVAYQEATRNSRSDGKTVIWSHTLVEYAAKRTGYHQLSTQPEKMSLSTFTKHYEEAIKEFIAGKPLSHFETNRALSHNSYHNGIDPWAKIRFYTPDKDGIRPCDKK